MIPKHKYRFGPCPAVVEIGNGSATVTFEDSSIYPSIIARVSEFLGTTNVLIGAQLVYEADWWDDRGHAVPVIYAYHVTRNPFTDDPEDLEKQIWHLIKPEQAYGLRQLLRMVSPDSKFWPKYKKVLTDMLQRGRFTRLENGTIVAAL